MQGSKSDARQIRFLYFKATPVPDAFVGVRPWGGRFRLLHCPTTWGSKRSSMYHTTNHITLSPGGVLETEELGSPLTHRYHYIRLLPPRHTLHILDIASHLHPSSIVGLFFCTSTSQQIRYIYNIYKYLTNTHAYSYIY